MKQSKTILVIGVILAILSIMTVTYEASTRANNKVTTTETSKATDSTFTPVVQKSLALLNLLKFRN